VVDVARNGINTIVFKTATVRFRRIPGRGDDGALGRETYVLRAGIASAAGLTRPDGSVTVRVPSGGATTIEAFGSRYELSLGAPPAPATTPAGVRQRLNLLGYPTGPAEGDVHAATESALLDFLADHGLPLRGFDPAGRIDEATRKALEAEAGI
jgi:hypothetical protein